VPDCRNWAWWDADLLREVVGSGARQQVTDQGNSDSQTPKNLNVRQRASRSLNVSKWKTETLTSDIKGELQLIADLYGDWREELITVLPGEIRIYQTNIPLLIVVYR